MSSCLRLILKAARGARLGLSPVFLLEFSSSSLVFACFLSFFAALHLFGLALLRLSIFRCYIFDFLTCRPLADRARAREFWGRRPAGAAELLDLLDFRAFRRLCPLASRYHPHILEGPAGVRVHRRRAVLGKEREKNFFRVRSTRCIIFFV